jgi:hypothetical protein
LSSDDLKKAASALAGQMQKKQYTKFKNDN